ncbi:MAG: methyl-accepting chemotaxis protein [Spirochaetaceae bacterium]
MIRITILLLIITLNVVGIFFNNFTNITSILSILMVLYLFYVTRNRKNMSEQPIEKEIVELEINTPKDDISEVIIEDKSEIDSNNQYSENFFYIKECLHVIENLSINTRKFEEDTLQSLFKEFEEIWSESEVIVRDTKESMKSIFDANSKDNLAYVLNTSKEINNDFTNFIPVLNVMNNVADKFIQTSIESFDTITKTTKDIVDLAEQVKVISINVRIEAARVKDSGGFKVLGNDISNFAERTSKVALSTNEQIKTTMQVIDSLKSELSQQLDSVKNQAQSIFAKVSPFEKILYSSSESVMDVIKKLNIISGELQSNLRNSISKLQYQDITNQESDHLIQILKQIEKVELSNLNFDETLTMEKKKDIRERIINYLKDISTTSNEENEVERLAKQWGVRIVVDTRKPGKENDDGVILF